MDQVIAGLRRLGLLHQDGRLKQCGRLVQALTAAWRTEQLIEGLPRSLRLTGLQLAACEEIIAPRVFDGVRGLGWGAALLQINLTPHELRFRTENRIFGGSQAIELRAGCVVLFQGGQYLRQQQSRAHGTWRGFVFGQQSTRGGQIAGQRVGFSTPEGLVVQVMGFRQRQHGRGLLCAGPGFGGEGGQMADFRLAPAFSLKESLRFHGGDARKTVGQSLTG